VLWGRDNDSYMFRDAPDLRRCVTCGDPLEAHYINPGFVLRRRQYDISATYDGVVIASHRLREWTLRHKVEGAEWTPLPSERDFFVLTATRAVAFDAKARRTRISPPCPSCGRPHSVAGAAPALLQVSGPLLGGFYRTDLEFGSGVEKHPLLMIDLTTGEKLLRERMAGLEVERACTAG